MLCLCQIHPIRGISSHALVDIRLRVTHTLNYNTYRDGVNMVVMITRIDLDTLEVWAKIIQRDGKHYDDGHSYLIGYVLEVL